jgi:dTDP-4-dehydrorhamnose reductase
MSRPTLLLTGCHGQMGTVFSQQWEGSELVGRYELVEVGRRELDIADPMRVKEFLGDLRPTYILNTAAYTRVDEAESDQESAYRVNEKAVGFLADWCKGNSCRLLHISTDFVFDGDATSPYSVDSETGPLSAYGASKLAGEVQVTSCLPSSGIVVRTSWLYSEHGQNFVKTMLRLMSEGRDVRVVRDQIGSPTSAHTLSRYITQLIATDSAAGIYHFTDGGELSWFVFAVAIREIGVELGLIPEQATVTPITATEYPTAARRPPYSVLERTPKGAPDCGATHSWRAELRSVLERIKAGPSGP